MTGIFAFQESDFTFNEKVSSNPKDLEIEFERRRRKARRCRR